ncbi:MAG TPA: FmdB family zinc ribbon protein [Vicinamibacterales bacterium]
MPLYEYQCEICGVKFEVIQKFADRSVDKCRTCGGPVHRLLSAPAIQFKGTGWYITDYARKGKGEGDTATVSSSGSNNGSTSTSGATSSPSNGSGSKDSSAASTSSTTTPAASTTPAAKKE